MPLLRFVQVSDLRFGHAPRWPSLRLPDRVIKALERDRKRLLERVVALAKELPADLVLLPGDLLDDAAATPEQAEELVLAIEELAPRPVFLGPGELDPPHSTSYFGPETLALMGKRPLPANLNVFRGAQPRTLRVGRVAVTGWATAAAPQGHEPGEGGPGLAEIARVLPPAAAGLHHVVVAHRLGPDPRQLPGADALTAAGLTYMALGHNGSPLSSRDRSGSIRLGLGGDPVLAEVPAKRGGLLVGELREDGSVEVDLVTTAERALHSVGCEVSTLCRPELLPGRVALLLREAGVRPRDLVVVTLEGSWPHATPPRIAPRAFEGQCYHLEVRPGRMWVPTLARRTVREAHLAALAPRPLDGHETARAAGLDLALAAWEGLEVIPPGENPADPA